MKPTDRLELRTVAFALMASLLLWNLPFGGVLLYPFKLLATWLHETSHGLAMIVTGVGFDHVTIYRDTSGLAYGASEAGGFSSAVIAAAGYMGTPLWGAVLLVVTPNARMARWALLLLAALLLGTAITVIGMPDGDTFGPWAVGAIGAACVAAALAVPARWRLAIAHFIAAQSCVNAILDIRVLLRPSQVVGGKIAGASDAHNMAAATFGTTATWAVWLWAIIWLLWSLGVLYVALRLSSRALAQIAPVTLEPTPPRERAIPVLREPRLAIPARAGRESNPPGAPQATVLQSPLRAAPADPGSPQAALPSSTRRPDRGLRSRIERALGTRRSLWQRLTRALVSRGAASGSPRTPSQPWTDLPDGAPRSRGFGTAAPGARRDVSQRSTRPLDRSLRAPAGTGPVTRRERSRRAAARRIQVRRVRRFRGPGLRRTP